MTASNMNRVTRASLIAALSYYSLPDLPAKDDGDDVWIRALALVTKYDGNDYFVCVEKNWKTMDNRVIKDFGAVGAICEYKAIYPFIFLDAKYMPTNLDKTKECRIAFLKSVNPTRSYDGLGIKELNKLIIGCAIRTQLIQEKNNKYYEQYYDNYNENGVEEEVGGSEDEAESEL